MRSAVGALALVMALGCEGRAEQVPQAQPVVVVTLDKAATATDEASSGAVLPGGGPLLREVAADTAARRKAASAADIPPDDSDGQHLDRRLERDALIGKLLAQQRPTVLAGPRATTVAHHYPPASASRSVGQVRWSSPVVVGGLSSQQASRSLAHVAGALRYCYRLGLRRDKALAGTVTAKLHVDTQGRAQHVVLVAATLKLDAMRGCLTRFLRRATFPHAAVPSIVRLPLRFTAPNPVP